MQEIARSADLSRIDEQLRVSHTNPAPSVPVVEVVVPETRHVHVPAPKPVKKSEPETIIVKK